MTSVMLTSLSGAGVVATWISRCGWSASQVSVRCTDVPGPARAVFLAIAGFLIVRRIDEKGCRRNVGGLSPMQLTVIIAIVLHPDLTQDFDRRNFPQKRRRGFSKQVAEQFPAILSNGFCRCQTTRLALGQPPLFDAMPIAIQPGRITVLQ